jgi:hypothetical protein
VTITSILAVYYCMHFNIGLFVYSCCLPFRRPRD